jgi:glycosyltransferase involved in cell wall biosynthesis
MVMDTLQDQVRFSVVIPAYNEAGYLGETLQSLRDQDFDGPFEVIVVDNHSTDETATVAAGFGVRLLYEAERGVCAARQRGSAAALGEIIVSTDADTVTPQNWLRSLDATFAAAPDAVAVAGPCRYANPCWWARVFPTLQFGLVAGVFAITGSVCYVTATNLAVRRSAFPGYDIQLTQGGDELDLLRRLRRAGRVIWNRHNVVTTSPRRLQQGLLYSIVVSFFVYYFLAYLVNRMSGRRLLGTAPAFRSRAVSPTRRRPRRRGALTLMVIMVAGALALVSGVGSAAVTALAGAWSP